MRPRTQAYRSLESVHSERDAVPWYWRVVAISAAFMLLGGFLILPATFENKSDLRVSATGLGIFGIALLTAGFALTGLVSFAIRNPLFQTESVHLPALSSCVIGLLTILYDFLVFNRYSWKLPALLLTIAAGVSTAAYSSLLVLAQRHLHVLRHAPSDLSTVPLASAGAPSPGIPLVAAATAPAPRDRDSSRWQDSSYYENYVRNMFPSSVRATNGPDGPVPGHITEEEMQRQQMLMLLLRQEDPHRAPAQRNNSSGTFHIEWPGRDEDDALTPLPSAYQHHSSSSEPHRFPAPESGMSMSTFSQQPQQYGQTPVSTLSNQAPSSVAYRRMTSDLEAWDGVWRTPVSVTTSNRYQRPGSQQLRDARRMEIEQGR